MHVHSPADHISPRQVEKSDCRFSSVCVFGNRLESLQSRSTLRWAITGATVGSKVLPNDHSLNYVGSHIL